MKITVINGPNLCLLGIRNKSIYGSDTLDTIRLELCRDAEKYSADMQFFVSNHEGEIIDRIHRCITDGTDAILLNAGALTHYSYALRDAVEALSEVGIPTWEVHLSDIQNREDFRKISVIRDVCAGCVSGLGKESYFEALRQAADYVNNKN